MVLNFWQNRCIKENIIHKETDFDKAIKFNQSLIKSADHCDKEKEFIENSMANAYTKNVLALLNGCPTYTLKRD